METEKWTPQTITLLECMVKGSFRISASSQMRVVVLAKVFEHVCQICTNLHKWRKLGVLQMFSNSAVAIFLHGHFTFLHFTMRSDIPAYCCWLLPTNPIDISHKSLLAVTHKSLRHKSAKT